MPEPSAGTQVTHCTHWIGPEQRHCHARDNVRLYLTGPRCPNHTPNALRTAQEAACPR